MFLVGPRMPGMGREIASGGPWRCAHGIRNEGSRHGEKPVRSAGPDRSLELGGARERGIVVPELVGSRNGLLPFLGGDYYAFVVGA
jgi:hypothetical protein